MPTAYKLPQWGLYWSPQWGKVCPHPIFATAVSPSKSSRINTYGFFLAVSPLFLTENRGRGYASDLSLHALTPAAHASFRRSLRTNPSRPLHSSHLGCKIPS